jgi:plastocyanin
MRLLIALWLLLLTAGAALAGDLTVTVRTPAGQPVANAVVSVAAPHDGPIRFAWPYRVAQRNMQFDPFVLIVPVGAEVAFPNLDNTRHQIYSFSPTHPFQLRLYGREETRTVRFERAGIVALGCNIHDSMIAFIVVVDTPYAARTDAQGQAVIRDVPAGPRAVRVWHPYLRAPGNALSLQAAVPAAGGVRVQATGALNPPPARHGMY